MKLKFALLLLEVDLSISHLCKTKWKPCSNHLLETGLRETTHGLERKCTVDSIEGENDFITFLLCLLDPSTSRKAASKPKLMPSRESLCCVIFSCPSFSHFTTKNSTGKEDEISGYLHVILLGFYTEKSSPSSNLSFSRKYLGHLLLPLSLVSFSHPNVGVPRDQYLVLWPATWTFLLNSRMRHNRLLDICS